MTRLTVVCLLSLALLATSAAAPDAHTPTAAAPPGTAAKPAAPPATASAAPVPTAQGAVAWQEFTEAPFLRAQATNRPILLCLTVRWSRPAQRALSELLNRPDVRSAIDSRYVPILVDADLRPDLRERFPGPGWPAITLLNGVGDPLYYQREKDKPPRRMTLDLAAIAPEKIATFLRESADYHRLRGARGAEQDRQAVIEEIRRDREKKVGTVDDDSLAKAAEVLRGNQDVVNGGFGRAPKFLVRTALEAALRLNQRERDPELLALVDRTLHAAAALEDPVEGGFHRLAGSENWTGLQYEKLLSRNADALECYVEAYKATLRDDYRLRASRIAGWMLKTMSLPGGGFSFAQTADLASEDGGGYYRATAEQRATMKRPEVLPVTIAAPSARAARALLRYAVLDGDEAARQRALIEIRFLDEKLWTEGRGVQHAWTAGAAVGPLLLEDQLAFIGAHFEAWEQTGLRSHFQRARDVARFVRDNLTDGSVALLMDRIPQHGGPTLLQAPVSSYEQNCEASRLFARLHYVHRDDAEELPQEPSEAGGTGTADLELRMVKRSAWAAAAKDLLEGAAGRYASLGPRAGDYALGASEFLEGPVWVFLVGDPTMQPSQRALLDAASRLDLGFAIRVVLNPGEDAKIITAMKLGLGAGEALYFAHNDKFSAPVTAPDQVAAAWKAMKAGEAKP